MQQTPLDFTVASSPSENEDTSNPNARFDSGLTISTNICQVDWKLLYREVLQIQCNWRNGVPWPPMILPAHHNHVITCLEVYKHWAITGSDDSSICVWDIKHGRCLINLFGHLGGVWSLTVLPPRKVNENEFPLLVSGSCDRTARVWQLDGIHWSCIATLFGHQSTVRCVAAQKSYSKSTSNISTEFEYIGFNTQTTSFLNANDTCTGFNPYIQLDLLRNSRLVVTGSRDTTLRLWSAVSGECLNEFRGHRGAIRCVQFTDFKIVSGSYDCTIRLWCVVTGDCLRVLAAHTNRVYTLLFDGKYIISGSLDTTIRVWDASTGTLERTFCGHRSLTSEMAFGESQKILVSSNADETIRVWNVVTGECMHILAGPNKHQSAVTCVGLIRNFIVSSSDDGTVKLWDIHSGAFVRDILRLDGAGRGGVIWRIVVSEDRLVCAAGSRIGMEPTKLVIIQFCQPLQQIECPDVQNFKYGLHHVCLSRQTPAPIPHLSHMVQCLSSSP